MENVKGLFTGKTDKNGTKINYETSKLKFTDYEKQICEML
jgi:hypothetical protein